MRTFAFLLLIIGSRDLVAQSLLDTLSRPTQNSGEFEILNQANQNSQNLANAVSKRANLLSRRVDSLLAENEKILKELEALRTDQDALKATVRDCRDQVLLIVDLIEKAEYAALAAPIGKLRAIYVESLKPKLLVKPVDNLDHSHSIDKGELAPVVVNPLQLRVGTPLQKDANSLPRPSLVK